MKSQMLVLIQVHSVPLEVVLSLLSSNPASALKLTSKGSIEVGKDADILGLDPNTLEPVVVIARGKLVATHSWTKSGMCV